jgi:hypothetical protein
LSFQSPPGIATQCEGVHKVRNFRNEVIDVLDDALHAPELADKDISFSAFVNARGGIHKCGYAHVGKSGLFAFIVQLGSVAASTVPEKEHQQDVKEGHIVRGQVGVGLSGYIKFRGIEAMEAVGGRNCSGRPAVKEGLKGSVTKGKEVIQVAFGPTELQQNPAAEGRNGGVVVLAKEFVFIPSEEEVSDVRGRGDPHGDTADLLDQTGTEMDKSGSEDGVEQGGDVSDCEHMFGGTSVLLCNPLGRDTLLVAKTCFVFRVGV